MKHKYVKIISIAILLIVILVIGSNLTNDVDIVEQYYGKWKVVQYIPLNKASVQQTIWQKEHYLGRTVEITEDYFKKSIFYWPDEIEEYFLYYNFCEVTDMDKNDTWITQNAESLRWLDGEYFEDLTIRMLRFYQDGEDYPEIYCAVTKDNQHLIVSWLSGEYLLERFDKRDENVTKKDIYGEWEIKRLDSYDDSYEGHVKDAENVPEYRIGDLNLTDFYAPNWFNKKVIITTKELKVDTNINEKVTDVKYKVVDKKVFEQEQGIKDGLSVDSKELLVYEICYGEKDDVLTVIPINKKKMLIHIQMGWFVLTK